MKQDFCQIRKNSLVVYAQYINDRNNITSGNSINIDAKKELHGRSYGYMQPSQKRKLCKIVELWTQCHIVAKKNVYGVKNSCYSLVTLTLGSRQIINDKECYRRLLMPFLQYCNRFLGLKNYIWRAEKQLNGNVHYHIIVDVFLPIDKLKIKWQQICALHGVGNIAINKDNLSKINSVDVRKIDNVHKVTAYVSKYLSKCEGLDALFEYENKLHEYKDNLQEYYNGLKSLLILNKDKLIDGRVWGCSDSLKQLKPLTLACDCVVDKLINDAMKNGNNKIILEEDFMVICNVNIMHLVNNEPILKEHYKYHFLEMFDSYIKNYS
jgi:hypothetical protein